MKKEAEFAPIKDGAGTPFPVADTSLPITATYPNNPMVRRAYVNVDLNAEQTVEWIRCKRDPIYFMETYLRIITLDDGVQPFKMYPFQKDMVKLYISNRFALTLTARQMGKCVKGTTMISIRSKKTGESHDIPIGVFHEWQRFVKWSNANPGEFRSLCSGGQGAVSGMQRAGGASECDASENA